MESESSNFNSKNRNKNKVRKKKRPTRNSQLNSEKSLSAKESKKQSSVQAEPEFKQGKHVKKIGFSGKRKRKKLEAFSSTAHSSTQEFQQNKMDVTRYAKKQKIISRHGLKFSSKDESQTGFMYSDGDLDLTKLKLRQFNSSSRENKLPSARGIWSHTLVASEPSTPSAIELADASMLTRLFQSMLGVRARTSSEPNTPSSSTFTEPSKMVPSSATSAVEKLSSTDYSKRRKKLHPRPFKHSKSVTQPNNCDSKFLKGFKDIRPLGRGGYGKVFKAKRIDDNTNYAVKYVHLPHDQEEQEKVLREWQALSHLKHVNIMQLFDTWTENLTSMFFDSLQDEMVCSDDEECFSLDTSSCSSSSSCDVSSMCGLFMQMELCDITLKEWLEKNPTRTKRVYYSVFRQIVEALDFIHKSKLIHRDIKPSNIFLLKNKVKVGDFGLVKGIHNSYNQYLSTESLNTSHLDLYVAPELKRGKSYKPTCKVDIYPLGLILLEMILKCKTVHEKYNLLQDARKFQFPGGFEQDYPKQSEFIRSMLESEPSLRPSAAEMLRSKFLQVTYQKRKNADKKPMKDKHETVAS